MTKDTEAEALVALTDWLTAHENHRVELLSMGDGCWCVSLTDEDGDLLASCTGTGLCACIDSVLQATEEE
jgi:hypothetical protein